MRKIEYKSPEELKKLISQNKKETSLFLKQLKKKKPENLDKIVHQLHNDAFSVFNCLECANCCKTLGPRLSNQDIERMSRYLKMKPSDFYSKFIVADQDNDLVFEGHPCPFLMPDNACKVYASRPKACLEYPHTNRNRFIQILDLTHKNCETCPVAFEIVDELKKVIFGYLCRY